MADGIPGPSALDREDRGCLVGERMDRGHRPTLGLFVQLVDKRLGALSSFGARGDKREMRQQNASPLQGPPAIADQAALQAGERGLACPRSRRSMAWPGSASQPRAKAAS